MGTAPILEREKRLAHFQRSLQSLGVLKRRSLVVQTVGFLLDTIVLENKTYCAKLFRHQNAF